MQLSHTPEFTPGTYTYLLPTTNPTPANTHYNTLTQYTNLSANNKIYTRILALTKTYQKEYSNICQFEIK